MIRAKNAANYNALKADVVKGGGKILIDRPEVNLMVVGAARCRVQSQRRQ